MNMHERAIERLSGSIVFDETGSVWEKRMEAMLQESSHIIALRGAGSFNGISFEDAKKLLRDQLIPRIQSYIEEGGGKVTIIFDGDNDDPKYPDIGHIMGSLRDYFGNKAQFVAVQRKGWYKYRRDFPRLRPLHSASGNEYDTVLFPDNTFSGEHDHFSQNERLAQSEKYEQWYIGACGLIACKQLEDYGAKAAPSDGVHRAVIFKAPVSVDQEQKIQQKIAEGEVELQGLEADAIKGDFNAADAIQGTYERGARLKESLQRRSANPYGLLFDPTGAFITKPEYTHLNIEVVE